MCRWRSPPRWCSSSPTAASTATARRQPSCYALLSALAEQPIRQSLAVTGSVNQRGEVQAIGGVNEKIEGFFDICRARGLNEQQGVLIPKVERAAPDAARGRGGGRHATASSPSIAIGTIDEGIEILTGVKAGERGAEGRFAAGTINRLVEDKAEVLCRARARLCQGRGQRRRRQRASGMISSRRTRRVRTRAGSSCSWARRTRAPSRSRRRCASPARSSPRSRACSSRTSSCSTARPTASCARCR